MESINEQAFKRGSILCLEVGNGYRGRFIIKTESQISRNWEIIEATLLKKLRKLPSSCDGSSEDYTLCIYIIYLNTTSTNSKLSSWVSPLPRRGDYIHVATNKVYMRVLSISNNNTLGIPVTYFSACVRLWEATSASQRKHNTQPLPGEKTLNTLATLSALG